MKKTPVSANESTDYQPSLVKIPLKGFYFGITKHTIQGKLIAQRGSMDSICSECFVFWNVDINLSGLSCSLKVHIAPYGAFCDSGVNTWHSQHEIGSYRIQLPKGMAVVQCCRVSKEIHFVWLPLKKTFFLLTFFLLFKNVITKPLAK